MSVHAYPGTPGSPLQPKARYGNFIGGQFVEPKSGLYFDNISPTSGKSICEIARSNADDVNAALDAAHAAAPAWGKTSTTERSNILNKIADTIEANLHLLALADTLDNGKPIRETMNADIPLTGSLPLFRRRHPRPRGQHRRDGREYPGVSPPRAPRRSRPDHSVELPDFDGGLETGAGIGGR